MMKITKRLSEKKGSMNEMKFQIPKVPDAQFTGAIFFFLFHLLLDRIKNWMSHSHRCFFSIRMLFHLLQSILKKAALLICSLVIISFLRGGKRNKR